MEDENILRYIILAGKSGVVKVTTVNIARAFYGATGDRDTLVHKFADLNNFELYIDKDEKVYYFRTKPKAKK